MAVEERMENRLRDIVDHILDAVDRPVDCHPCSELVALAQEAKAILGPSVERWDEDLLDPVLDCPTCEGTGKDSDGRPCECTAPPGTFQGEWPT